MPKKIDTSQLTNPMFYLNSTLRLWAGLGLDIEECASALCVTLVTMVLNCHDNPEEGLRAIKRKLDECFQVGARMCPKDESVLTKKDREKEH